MELVAGPGGQSPLGLTCLSPNPSFHGDARKTGGEDGAEVVGGEGDAALGGGVGGGCDVQEDGGAAVRDGGTDVPIEDADDVIDRIWAVEDFVPGRVGDLDVGIVGGVVWIVAPGVCGADGFDGEMGYGRFFAVGAVKHA